MSIRSTIVSAALAICLIVFIAGCGSSSSSSSTSGGSTGSSSSSSASSSSSSSSSASGGSVKGVPTLAEQYKPDESAPPSSSPPIAKGKTIWYIECGAQIPGCVTKGKDTQAAAEAVGWTVHIANANLGIANGYNTAIDQAIAAKPSAIIVDSFSCQPAQQSLTKAREDHIPVLAVESTDCSEYEKTPNLYTVPYIPNKSVANWKEWFQQRGTRAAEYIIQQTKGNLKLIDSPAEGDPDYVYESNAFAAELKKCSTCQIVGSSPWHEADLTPNGPWISGIREQLVKNSDANAVLFPYEAFSLTLGGIQAIKSAHVNAIAFGGVSDPGGIEAVRDGQLTAITNARSVDWEAYGAIDELNRYFNHKPAVPEGVGQALITQGHNLPASGDTYIPSINYKADYDKAWGVS
jgi:ribose transport system substrate-binding protein